MSTVLLEVLFIISLYVIRCNLAFYYFKVKLNIPLTYFQKVRLYSNLFGFYKNIK